VTNNPRNYGCKLVDEVDVILGIFFVARLNILLTVSLKLSYLGPIRFGILIDTTI
jgi:hypothetical protein